MSIRSKQTTSRTQSAGTTERVTWPGKRSAAQVASKNRNIGPGKRSRTQGLPAPVRPKPPT